MARRKVKKIENPRFSDVELQKLGTAFITQLPTVAALLAAAEEDFDSMQIAEDAIDLVDSLMLRLANLEAEEITDED